MIKIENVDTYGWKAAIRGMRNPLASWDKSDSTSDGIGPADLKLMRQLAKAGTDHAKYLRFIHVSMDITAPLYWWKEFDTYRVGVEKNSCSTMHCIHKKEFTLDDFSGENLRAEALKTLLDTTKKLNQYRNKYLETKSENFWWQMIQLLPSSYNQMRTVEISYQALWNMYQARKNHKLYEWREFCSFVENLPYFYDIFLTEE